MAQENQTDGSEDDDIVVVTEEDLPEGSPPEETPAPEAAASVEPEGDELESYSKNVQKRINKLTERLRKEERDREEAVRLAQQLLQRTSEMEGRLQQLDSGYLQEYGARIKAQIEAAQRNYAEAHGDGDTDKMIKAQEVLFRAISDQQRYDLAKARQGARPAAQTQQPQPQTQPQPQQQPQQQPPQTQVDPRARSWAEKNTWFGQDEVMTYSAFAVHRQLVDNEGFDPQSDEYYTEVDRRMRAEFPHKFVGASTAGKTRVAPAGSSASRANTSGRRTVKLTPSQVSIAKRLGVPLELYAKHVKQPQ